MVVSSSYASWLVSCEKKLALRMLAKVLHCDKKVLLCSFNFGAPLYILFARRSHLCLNCSSLWSLLRSCYIWWDVALLHN